MPEVSGEKGELTDGDGGFVPLRLPNKWCLLRDRRRPARILLDSLVREFGGIPASLL